MREIAYYRSPPFAAEATARFEESWNDSIAPCIVEAMKRLTHGDCSSGLRVSGTVHVMLTTVLHLSSPSGSNVATPAFSNPLSDCHTSRLGDSTTYAAPT